MLKFAQVEVGRKKVLVKVLKITIYLSNGSIAQMVI